MCLECWVLNTALYRCRLLKTSRKILEIKLMRTALGRSAQRTLQDFQSTGT